jgi:hypothetical protein
MKVSRQESVTQPFVLGHRDLEKFVTRAEMWLSTFKFEINCKDKLKREFSTLPELFQFENSPTKDIRALRIFGMSKNTQTHLWLKLDKDFARNIFISLEADEAEADGLNEAIEDLLSVTKPWYAVVARAESWIIFWFLLSIISGIMSVSNFAAGKIHLADFANWKIIVVLIVAIVATGIFHIIITKLRLAIFPMGVFAIGQGTKRHKDKELMRTGIVVAFAVSLAASIIATFIFALRG